MPRISKKQMLDRLKRDTPNEKQIEFFMSQARHTAYGGARGGGKSWAMRRKFVLLAMRYKGLRLLLLRRTMPELRKNHIGPLLLELGGYASYKLNEKAFIFPNLSRLELGYCDNDGDLLQYQGAEYDVIGFEEATNFKPEWITFISTSLRTTRLDFSPRIYYTCNPGGVGHSFIKRLFIDRRFEENEDPDDYKFIPARVYDNKVLMKSNPEYLKLLEALPPHKRRAHLDGDWNVYEGQVFEEFRDCPEHYSDGCFTHVIPPFKPPDSWRIFRSFDFGYSKPFSCGWWGADGDGRLYRIFEFYGCVKNMPDTGIKLPPEKIFEKIAEIERSHEYLRGKHILGVADPAIWEKSGGISIAETAEKYGIYFDKGDNKRIPGWMQLHYRMRFDENGIPMIYVFSTCRDFIRTVPTLCYDSHMPEDVDSSLEDHIADETRYMCMRMPILRTKSR